MRGTCQYRGLMAVPWTEIVIVAVVAALVTFAASVVDNLVSERMRPLPGPALAIGAVALVALTAAVSVYRQFRDRIGGLHADRAPTASGSAAASGTPGRGSPTAVVPAATSAASPSPAASTRLAALPGFVATARSSTASTAGDHPR